MNKKAKTMTSQRSETAGESTPTKNHGKNRGKKRKRGDSERSNEYEDVLPENTLEMEKSLHASAIKNNLDDVSVRKILKKVITNDHVLALVKLREEEDSGPEENSLQPKLTRAKVKELMKESPKSGAWNLENLELTPIKHIPVKTRPEVKALIAQELPEDEDDDEYEPTHEDVPSDDDQAMETCSDLESQPRTPATPRSQLTENPKVVQDGPFKLPQELTAQTRRKLDPEEEATIARRTRSKLSLSATSIEHIESTFVPPDEVPLPVRDDLWDQFLNECLNPASTSKHEDDDETDPEYNVAADPDAHDEDEEALGNSIIKISKKELNDLVTELFNIMPEASVEDDLANNLASSVLTENDQSDRNVTTRWEGKQEPISDDEHRESLVDKLKFEKRSYSRISIGKTEPMDSQEQVNTHAENMEGPTSERVSIQNDNTEVVKPQEVNKEASVVCMSIEEGSDSPLQRAPPLLRELRPAPNPTCLHVCIETSAAVLPEQILILQQQIRQHVQLATSNYLQLYVHPLHWSYGPTYKEYLESLAMLAENNPNSVVNVCNLKPAIDLVDTWEKTVAANTPENAAMVEFIQQESDRCRRRSSSNSFYVGDFHETFKKVVANSTVFLYPYLLPAMPFRAETCRRFAYLRSEDELIALGLDQFWQYVEDNPSIYKTRGLPHSRQRLGFAETVQLMIKHMFPWIPYRVMAGHIYHVKKHGDKDNPISKFFASREVTPVQHKLLAYNPQLTLYEQPEHEMPRLWLRYLSKASKRFRNHLFRRTNVTGVLLTGVPIEIGKSAVEPTKAPLPIDFTKEIVSNRQNITIHPPKPVLADKFDVKIAGQTIALTPTIVANKQIDNTLSSINEQEPILIAQSVNTSAPSMQTNLNTPIAVATHMYTLVETSTGAFLMPLANVSTVNANVEPITTPAEIASEVTNPPKQSKVNEEKNSEHCKCCVLLSKICKLQTVITDYFKPNKNCDKSCYCKNVKYPKISNKLRLLIRNYKNSSQWNLHALTRMMKRNDKKDVGEDEMDISAFDIDDIAFVTSFHLKLIARTVAARKTYIKKRVNTIFSKFDIDAGDPTVLANHLYTAFDVELVDIYKEFLAFLTPQQADKVGVFKDYFTRACAEDLMRKTREHVRDTEARNKILSRLRKIFLDNKSTACQMCSSLLEVTDRYPELAKYVFSLFPHKWNRLKEKKKPTASEPSQEQPINVTTFRNDTNATVHYEADHSSRLKEKKKPTAPEPSQEQPINVTTFRNDTNATVDYEADHSSRDKETSDTPSENAPNNAHEEGTIIVIKTEDPSSEDTTAPMCTIVSQTEGRSDSDGDSECNTSMLIVFEDETVKTESPEWKRDEDKLILEVLKEHLTPEERNDKTIIEILVEKNVFEMISERLTHKSLDEVKNRVLYLLQLL